ncbi:hypothetical protein EFP50_08485 [Lacticaseibacillus paracasei]|nr:hypothetical protein [Lacticaseibacillus paracasei]RWZ66019.1 hypothetical protein EQK34_06950 [Lacticaseibacillus paracasei]
MSVKSLAAYFPGVNRWLARNYHAFAVPATYSRSLKNRLAYMQADFLTDGITSTHTNRHVSIFLLTHRCVEQRIHRRSQWPGQNPGSAKTTVTVIPSLTSF